MAATLLELSASGNGIYVLGFSPVFVSDRDSEAFCSAKFAQALVDAGANVTVFCGELVLIGGMKGISSGIPRQG